MTADDDARVASATPFAPAEFAERHDRLRAELERASLDALLVTSRPNFDYFTGFVVQQPWDSLSRNLIAILPREGPGALLVPANMEGEAQAGSAIRDIRLHTALGEAPVSPIAGLCAELGLAGSRIGAELGREQRLNLSHLDVLRLQDVLTPATLVDATDAIWSVRVRKSAAELACLRRAAAITARVFERIHGEVAGPRSEREIAHRVRQLMLEEGADAPGWVMLTSGPGEYHRTFGTPRDRRLMEGDMLFMDLAVRVHGYWSDFGRAAVVGEPTAAQVEAQAATIAASAAGVAAIGPGVPIAEVARAGIDALAAAGFPLAAPGRIGHGMGLLSSEPPNVALDDPTVLAPGMVITLEPTIIRHDGMFQCEHVVAVTEDGYEVLPDAPGELRSLPAA